MGGGPCNFSVSPSPFGLDFGTLDFRLGLDKKFVCGGGGRVQTKNMVLLRSRSLSLKSSELDLT